MSQTNVQLRSVEPSDFSELAELIKDTWHYEEIASKRNAMHIAYIFLYASMSNQNFAKVALVDDELVGVIMGRGRTIPFRNQLYKLKLGYHLFRLFLTNEGREAIQSFRRTLAVNQALSKNSKESFDGELSLFAVKNEIRGMGIGSRLFDSFIIYQESIGSNSYFLYTDTSCLYTFYDHKNLKRISVIQRNMPFMKKNMRFFLYKGEL